MTERRFTVRKVACQLAPGHRAVGWAVYDREQRITIPFANYDEALMRRDTIHELYLRYGW
ncbi:MAG TPA: hypothetical protein VGJ20_09050 [Xanthobacteraceae bacterium]